MSALGYFFRRVFSAPKSMFQTFRAGRHFEKNYQLGKSNAAEIEKNLAVSQSEASSKVAWSASYKSGRKVQDVRDMRRNYFTIKQTFLRYPFVKGAKVASIGSGLGDQELFLAKDYSRIKEVHAVDPTPEHIVDANKKKNEKKFLEVKDKVFFSEGSFAETNLPEKQFDCVMSIDALHWAEDRFVALKNMKSLINPKSKNKVLLLTYRERPGHTRMSDSLKLADGTTRREFAMKNFRVDLVKSDLEKLGFVVDPVKKIGLITVVVARLK